MAVILTVVLVLVAIVWYFYTKPPPPKVFGVYSQPGSLQFIKEFIFRKLMSYRKRQSGQKEKSAGYGRSILSDIEKEQTQKLSNDPKAIDAVYFNGGNAEGAYIVAALARRPRGVFNALLYLRHPQLGVLQLPRMPDTLVFGDPHKWSAEGLKITPQEPMRTWRLQYGGQMRKWTSSDKEDDCTGEIVEVQIELQWTATFKHFDFDGDVSIPAFSRSMAKEQWSKKYFEDLKKAHQTHYEQMGRLNGYAVVAGQKYDLSLLSMRDHSYGIRREWRLLHRYALHMLHTEDGTQLNVGIVSQPITCSHLELGYIGYKGKTWKAISRVDMDLWRYGEEGQPPKDYAFSFQEEGGINHYVQVEVLDAPVFFMGWEWEARLVECFVKFKLDGVPGFGVVEYQYNNGPGDHRPQRLAKEDPTWTRELNKG